MIIIDNLPSLHAFSTDDVPLVAVFPKALVGVAIATGIGQMIGGLVPVIYFLRENDSLLKLVKPRMDIKTIVKACTNGSSEMVNVIAASTVGILYNHQLLKIAGQNGVAAYGIIMYITMIFQAVFMGYAVGTAPIVSYHYGVQNTDELKSLRKKSINIIVWGSAFFTALGDGFTLACNRRGGSFRSDSYNSLPDCKKAQI